MQQRKVGNSHHNSELLGRERICSQIWTLNNYFPCSRIIKASFLSTHPFVVLYFPLIIQHAFLWVTFPYGGRVQWVLILQSFFNMCVLGCQESPECTVYLVMPFHLPALARCLEITVHQLQVPAECLVKMLSAALCWFLWQLCLTGPDFPLLPLLLSCTVKRTCRFLNVHILCRNFCLVQGIKRKVINS